MDTASNYDRDFYAWASEQAALLRAGKISSADWLNIAEEIESMGRSEKRELINRLEILLLHLLKWEFQSALRAPSWEASINVQRYRLSEHLADNPSLKAKIDEALASAYRGAVLEAVVETRLPKSTFPSICPYSFAEAINEDFWPS